MRTDLRSPEKAGSSIARLSRSLALLQAVGLRPGLGLLYDRAVGSDIPKLRTVKPANLEHPFQLTGARSDVGMFTSVVVNRCYELPPTLDHVVSGLPIVDIGASIGMSAAYFASKFPDSRVFAIEANPDHKELLENNTTPYGDRIVAINRVFGLPHTMAQLRSTNGGSNNSHGSFRFESVQEDIDTGEGLETISGREIVSHCADGIGLLKVNVEGAEKMLFGSGAMDEILGVTKVLYVETHDRYVPGCTDIVDTVAAKSGLQLYHQPRADKFIYTAL